MAGFLGKGDVYIRRTDGKLLSLGNVTQFAIDETEADVKIRYSRQKDSYGQAVDRYAIQKPAKITIKTDEITPETLADILRGTLETITDAGTVTDESITAEKGSFVELAHSGVSDVVVKDSAGSITYVEGTDYEVRPNVGLILIKDDGSIADGDNLKVSYTYDESGISISGSQMPEIECKITFDGINQIDGKKYEISIDKARIMPTSPIDLLSDDFTDVTFEGTLITVEGKTKPYEVKQRG
jgi:hypothetical protein